MEHVAVVIPAYNAAKTIEATVRSALSQTALPRQVIVVDDGSDDGTAEEMARRAAEDPRLRYIRRTGDRGGANVCRNLGVKNSTGEFIVFLDSDDLLAPDCLSRRVEIMQRNADLDFVTFQTGVFVKAIGDLGRQLDPALLGDDLLRFLYFEPPWIITSPVWRRQSFLQLGMFDEALKSWQDLELHIRALTAGLHYVRFTDVDHHVRWQHDVTKVSIEQRRSPQHLDAALDVLEKIERLVRQGPGMNWVRLRALCGLYFFVAQCWVEMGKFSRGLQVWRRVAGRASPGLRLSGSILLGLQACHFPGYFRIINKWKGKVRMRTNPEILAEQALK